MGTISQKLANLRIFMNKSLETMLCHLKDFAPFKEPTNSSHFPIYNTATFDLKNQNGDKIYDYTRSDNPTRATLENFFAFAGNVTFSIKSCFSSHLANFFANFSLAFILTFRLLIPSDIR